MFPKKMGQQQYMSVWLTMQSLHPIQLGEKLINYTVSDTCAVMASPGGQGIKLIEKQDARLGSLRPEMEQNYSVSIFYVTHCNLQLQKSQVWVIRQWWSEMFSNLLKTFRTPCSLAPMYLLRSSGPWRDWSKYTAWLTNLYYDAITWMRQSQAYLDADEIHTTFFGDGSCQQGLSCTGSSI